MQYGSRIQINEQKLITFNKKKTVKWSTGKEQQNKYLQTNLIRNVQNPYE